MTPHTQQSVESLGLLACGASGRWRLDVDESASGDECFLELDGPEIYVVVRLRNLAVLQETLDFLLAPPASDEMTTRREKQNDALPLKLGWFGSAAVTLTWDNEGFPRCFLIVEAQGHCALRLSLGAEDIEMLTKSLHQIVADLETAAN